jgi:hypothetical protein
MDSSRRNRIIITVVCLIGAIVITVIFYNPFGQNDTGLNNPIQMLCSDCGAKFEISNDEYKRQMTKKGAIGPMGPTGAPPGLTCPECGQESAYIAVKCKECGAVFFPKDVTRNAYWDRCPECGYSAIEEKHRTLNNKR